MTGSLLLALSNWLEATRLSGTIQAIGWLIPLIQTLHILSVAVLLSSAILVDLRVLGLLQRDAPLTDVGQRFLPVIWPVLLVLLVSGTLLIVGEPRRSLLNTSFYLKMALLPVAIVLTVGLQRSLAVTHRDTTLMRRVTRRLVAVASMLTWCGIVFAGRWIAYTQTG
jgi:hypothetical protein